MSEEEVRKAEQEIAFQCDGKCRVCPFPGASCIKIEKSCVNGDCLKMKGEDNA